MKKLFFLIVFFQSIAFAQPKEDTALTTLRNYLKHFSSQDSGIIFFHSNRESYLHGYSSKTANSFSFVKQKNVDTPLLFLDNSISDLGDTETYFQDGKFYYEAQNAGKLQKNIHTLKKKPIDWINILRVMNTHLFTRLLANKDDYFKFFFYGNPKILEKDTSITGITCKQLTLTDTGPDTNVKKIVTKFYFRSDDSLLIYFSDKQDWFNVTNSSECILDSVSHNVSKKILLKKIEKKKNYFLRTCTLILDIAKSNGILMQKPLNICDRLPNFEGVDTNGKLVTLQNFENKYILLDFWFAGCGPCIASVKPLKDFYSRYKDKGLEIISLNAYDDLDVIKRVVKRNSIPYTSLHIEKKTEQAFPIDGYPSFFLFDQNHELVYTQKGFGFNFDELISAFEKEIHRTTSIAFDKEAEAQIAAEQKTFLESERSWPRWLDVKTFAEALKNKPKCDVEIAYKADDDESHLLAMAIKAALGPKDANWNVVEFQELTDDDIILDDKSTPQPKRIATIGGIAFAIKSNDSPSETMEGNNSVGALQNAIRLAGMQHDGTIIINPLMRENLIKIFITPRLQ